MFILLKKDLKKKNQSLKYLILKLFFVFHNYSFSTTAAAPIPEPMHIEITPNFFFYLFNSGNKVAIYLAPVHPKGWPKAIAPPLGLILL